MAKPAKANSVRKEVTQDAPTEEQKRDAFGRLLDGWGLPLNGPCRTAALEALGLGDPNDDPEAWDGRDAPEAAPFAAAQDVDAASIDDAQDQPAGVPPLMPPVTKSENDNG